MTESKLSMRGGRFSRSSLMGTMTEAQGRGPSVIKADWIDSAVQEDARGRILSKAWTTVNCARSVVAELPSPDNPDRFPRILECW